MLTKLQMHRWKNLLTERFANTDAGNSQLGIQLAYLTRASAEGSLPRAAVAFIIKVFEGRDLCVLLTKRSLSLRDYGGDVCLPGGRYDPSDHNLVNTALRETQEEVGITARDLEYICTLRTLPAGIDRVTAVTPVVFLANNDLTININTNEVEIVFWVPLDVFLEENTRMPNSYVHIKEGRKFSAVAFNYFDDKNQTSFLIWGFTAKVCVLAASTALNKPPHFPFTVLALVHSHSDDPNDDGTVLAEVVMRQSLDHYNSNNKERHVYLQNKL